MNMLTLKEVAQEIKVTRRTVYRWVKLGKLKAIKIDGIWRVRDEDYEKFISVGRN